MAYAGVVQMTEFIAAIDQGTTSTRCMIFDPQADVVSIHQREHDQIYPRPGWVEHDPIQIWDRTQIVLREALERAGIGLNLLTAIGVTNQRETTLVWDRKTGKPYYNAIVWQDTRTDKIIAALGQEGGQDRFRAETGLPLSTYFSGPKVRWILDNVPEAKAAAQRGDAIFGNMDTWLIWNLTGGAAVGRTSPM